MAVARSRHTSDDNVPSEEPPLPRMDIFRVPCTVLNSLHGKREQFRVKLVSPWGTSTATDASTSGPEISLRIEGIRIGSSMQNSPQEDATRKRLSYQSDSTWFLITHFLTRHFLAGLSLSG